MMLAKERKFGHEGGMRLWGVTRPQGRETAERRRWAREAGSGGSCGADAPSPVARCFLFQVCGGHRHRAGTYVPLLGGEKAPQNASCTCYLSMAFGSK